MPTNYNRLAVSSEYAAVNYLPATLKTNKSGWLIEYYVENPLTQELARKMYTPIKDVAARYLEEIEKNLRPATYRTYKTFIKVFSE